jgi:two-component system, cell cycle sensor histidine kinase and response regulator CckA
VVEDDATVREFTIAVLKPYGYNVLQARSGVDALEVWSRYSGAIDLLLTDIVMPDGMTGPELATRLQAGKPDLPVVFTSGYGQKMMAQVLGSRNVARFVHKPCAPRTLAKAVREILDASAA